MPRTRDTKVKSFHFIPPEDIITWDLKIDSVSVKTVIWSAEFTRAIAPEIGFFKIVLDNNNGEFNEKYSGDEVVEFFIDRASGTTRRFKGQIDTIKNPYDSKGYTLIISGYHVSGELISDIHVTESYDKDSTTVDSILKDIVDTYLTGYTYTNVATSIEKPEVNWDNKPFWECVFDLCKIAKTGILFDCYVDDDKDFHFFQERTVINSDEAIVSSYNLISAPAGLGNQSLTKKSKIRVIGDDGTGLPVLSTAGTGTKEEVIFDSKITTTLLADEVSSSILSLKNQTPREGEGTCYQLPSLSPGDLIWYANPPQKIIEQIKIYKYTQSFPMEHTKYWIYTSREIPHIFKKRIELELASQTVTNPFRMRESLNLTFDSEDELVTKDANVGLSEGKIKLTGGASGVFIASKTFNFTVNKIHLLVIGSDLIGTKYEIRKAGEDSFQTITTNTEITLAERHKGAKLDLRVTINSTTTEINSIALLAKD